MRARWSVSVLFAVALTCAASVASAASDWQVIKVGMWDYLTVDNVAKFYGFAGEVEPIDKTIRLDNGKNQLEVTLGSREAIVNGVRNWLCFPVIEHGDGKYLISRIDLAKTIEPQFRPHMIPNLRPLKTVVIDAGHGGIEKGASSSYGNEKDFSLDVAKRLKPLLEAKGLRVVMTRDRDEVVPLPLRANIANATKDSIFVSIHFNATDYNSAATGFEIYSLTPRGAPSTQDNALLQRFANMQAGSPVDAASLILSTSVYHAMLGYMPEFDRGVKRARFAVLRRTQIPAILVEGGFLTERQESRLIARPEWRAQLAQAISVGIESYKNLAEKKQRPLRLADYRRQFEGVLVARDGNAPAPMDAPPPVFAVSNQLEGLKAQMTTAVHHDPSPQLSINELEGEEGESAGAPPDPSPPMAPNPEANSQDDVAANTPPAPEPSESPAADPATEDASVADGASPTPEAAQPEAPQVAPPEAPSVAQTETAPPHEVAAATPPPQPTVVRKYWVLKFTPPPKFRQ